MATLIPLPALRDNYIWTLSAADGRAVIVDPGEAAPVHAAAEQGLRPVAILLTHHHADHVAGMHEIRDRYGARCYAPVDDRIEGVDERVVEGDQIAIPALGNSFRILEIPGHTRSHVAFVDTDIVFCGDTLFSLGCGRMFEGTPPQMLASLDRLATLPPYTRVCCGHEYTQANARFAATVEPDNRALHARNVEVDQARAAGLPTLPSTLREELAANPFLRVDEESVIRAVCSRLGRQPIDRSETFATLRSWKDTFGA